MKRGFSMIEIIIVLAVLGLLLSLATPNYRRWRANVQVQQAAQQLADTINKARSESRRKSLSQTLTLGTNQYSFSGTTITVPATITLSPDSTTSLTFSSPYGSSSEPLRTFTFSWASDNSIQRTVRVVGVMGKVIIQ